MKIVYDPVFSLELKSILHTIAQDRPMASTLFKNEIRKRIYAMTENPWMYRKSIYFDNQNIRDMIYKGYTLIYEISPLDDAIHLLSIFNRNKPDV
jgi:hypothetical protein